MANVETLCDEHAVQPVTQAMGNYSHFNMFKRLHPGTLDDPSHAASTLHRQARVDALPAPRGYGDVVSVLSDTADAEYPVFREYTVGTFILDGASGVVRVWCCGQAAGSGPPVYAWNISSFWDDEPRPPAPTLVYA
mmetsp:Transcript_40048/g.124702  ORF Transcript_40048/g.124702 Transcript_40048/m.124702 type:complete len:136 (-) Transcript_40048:90-497(-)